MKSEIHFEEIFTFSVILSAIFTFGYAVGSAQSNSSVDYWKDVLVAGMISFIVCYIPSVTVDFISNRFKTLKEERFKSIHPYTGDIIPGTDNWRESTLEYCVVTTNFCPIKDDTLSCPAVEYMRKHGFKSAVRDTGTNIGCGDKGFALGVLSKDEAKLFANWLKTELSNIEQICEQCRNSSRKR